MGNRNYKVDKEKIKALMLHKKMTVSDMLDLAGISRATWQRITSSDRETSFPNVAAIAYALGVDPTVLIAEADDDSVKGQI